MPIVEILGITLAAWGIPVILLQQLEFIRAGLASRSGSDNPKTAA